MLYTRKGDKGTTKVFGCDQRFSKSSTIAEALGALDELNSFLGLCRSELREGVFIAVPIKKRKRSVEKIVHDTQMALFIIQAEVAGAGKHVSKAKVVGLETIINTIEKALPPITTFSISGGTKLSAHFDVARTVARRAERRVVAVHEEGMVTIRPNTLAYLNRLSSLLFALARYANHVAEVDEEAPTYK